MPKRRTVHEEAEEPEKAEEAEEAEEVREIKQKCAPRLVTDYTIAELRRLGLVGVGRAHRR